MVDLHSARVLPRGEGGIAQRTLAGFLLLGSGDALPLFEMVEANQSKANLIELLDARLRELDPGAFGLLFTSAGDPYLLAWGSLVATVESAAARAVVTAQPGRSFIGRVHFGPVDDKPQRMVLAQDSSSTVTEIESEGHSLEPNSALVKAHLVEVVLGSSREHTTPPEANGEIESESDVEPVEVALGQSAGDTTAGAEAPARAVEPPPAARDIVFADDLAEEPAASMPAASDTPTPSSVHAPTLVLGTSCPAGHHNHPDAERCSRCGAEFGADQTKVLINGPRPPLGVLVVDDGTTYSLDHDIIVGREPGKHPDVLDGIAVPLPLTDSSLSLSRRHARIILDEWSVGVIDLGSSNGTWINRNPNSEDWQPVPSDEAVAVAPGDRLRVGGRVIQLEV